MPGVALNITKKICHTIHLIICVSGVAINIKKICHTRHPIIPLSGVAFNIAKNMSHQTPNYLRVCCGFKNLKKNICHTRHLIVPMSGVNIQIRHSLIYLYGVTRKKQGLNIL